MNIVPFKHQCLIEISRKAPPKLPKKIHLRTSTGTPDANKKCPQASIGSRVSHLSGK
jgi:hypothetical protein